MLSMGPVLNEEARKTLESVVRSVLGKTPAQIRDMADAVDERAMDLEEWGDPRDYDTPDGLDRHVQKLYDTANFLYRLADLIETGGARRASV